MHSCKLNHKLVELQHGANMNYQHCFDVCVTNEARKQRARYHPRLVTWMTSHPTKADSGGAHHSSHVNSPVITMTMPPQRGSSSSHTALFRHGIVSPTTCLQAVDAASQPQSGLRLAICQHGGCQRLKTWSLSLQRHVLGCTKVHHSTASRLHTPRRSRAVFNFVTKIRGGIGMLVRTLA
ncbi:hypothetical protein IQ07DRAFT_439634 [Pyrenochaeta sp. DS3sAY3a]|nr:hypothetical protein IQ07DRAFT_439634 [Pyrenochaeta sp. DS3sAY3a]